MAHETDPRLIEIMAELLAQAHVQTEALHSLGADVKSLQREQAKTNLALGELRLSVMKLADKIEDIAELDKRLRVVEAIVLRPTP